MPTPALTLGGVNAPASYGTSVNRAPKVRKTEYGDGYEHVMPTGINADPFRAQVIFGPLTDDEYLELEEFFTSRAGVELFSWIPPFYDDPIYCRCSEWDAEYREANNSQITAMIYQVFDPV